MRALAIGADNEVITVAHTFVATVAVIVHCGATLVLADVREDFNRDVDQLESAVTPRTKAILPVQLNCRVCETDAIMAVGLQHGLAIAEDATQALCSRYRGRVAGCFGDAGCFCRHALKNLSVGGDGGFIATGDRQLAEILRLTR